MQIISSQLHLTWKWIHCPLKSFSICILLNFSDASQFHQRHHCCSSHSLIPSSFNKSDHSIPNNIFSPYPLAFLNSTSPIESTDCVSMMTNPYLKKCPSYHPKGGNHMTRLFLALLWSSESHFFPSSVWSFHVWIYTQLDCSWRKQSRHLWLGNGGMDSQREKECQVHGLDVYTISPWRDEVYGKHHRRIANKGLLA